jgi:REP element-mobilizing transposase RayT
MASTYANLNYHFVFSTKDRRPFIQSDWKDRLHEYLGGTVRGMGGMPLAIGGIEDHVHILASLKPVHCVAEFMRDLKRASSSWVHDELERSLFAWQEGYAAFSVGYPGPHVVHRYVENQVVHHHGISSYDEMLVLCEENGVEVDMRYFE